MKHQTIKKKTMKRIERQLSQEMAEFKKIYLMNVEKYLKEEFKRLDSLTEKQVIEERGYLETRYSKEPVKRHTKASFAYWNKISNIKYKGELKFLKAGILTAELNFEKSLKKVFDKCEQKGLNLEKSVLNFYSIVTGKQIGRAHV